MKGLSFFVSPIKGFGDQPHTCKVEAFGWYLHEVKGKSDFTAAELGECYDAVHLPRPGNLHGTVAQIVGKKPARLLKNSKGGLRLSAAARASMEKLLPLRPSAVQTTAILNALAVRVTNPAQAAFLNETLACFRNGAYRAAIVMAWNLAWSDVCDRIFASHEPAFNTQRAKAYPKLAALTKRTDFEDYKESQVVEIARGAGIFNDTVAKALKEKLTKRNSAAHPSSSVMLAVTAEEVIHDLVENVLLSASF
jgi:hypothetical protein